MRSGSVSFVIDLKPFERQIDRLGDELALGRICRAAMVKAARPCVAAAKRLARRESGLLAQSIGAVVRQYKNSKFVVGVIGPRKEIEGTWKGRRRVPTFYAHLVEFGARPHAIGSGSVLERRSTRRGKPVVLGPGPQHGRQHPGAKAHPYLRPAFDANRATMEAILAQELAAGLKRELGD